VKKTSIIITVELVGDDAAKFMTLKEKAFKGSKNTDAFRSIVRELYERMGYAAPDPAKQKPVEASST